MTAEHRSGGFKPGWYEQYIPTIHGVYVSTEFDPKKRLGPSVIFDPRVLGAMELDLFTGEAGERLGQWVLATQVDFQDGGHREA